MDCDFFRGPIQRIDMSDVEFTLSTRGAACVLDRFDGVASFVAFTTDFFYFYIKLSC